MEINKKNRTELKAFFQANNIPTEQHFADFVDAGLNQAEDGIAKVQGRPLALEPEGETAGTQEILQLFSNFANDNPDWSLNLNPRVAPGVPDSNQPGFNIKDAAGQSRWFIQSGNGNIGVGTIEPEARLTVQGTGNGSLIAAVADTEQHSRIFEVTEEAGSGMLSLRAGDATLTTRLSGAIATPSFFLGRVGLGTQTPQAPLSISGPGEDGTPDTSMHITSQSILFGGSNAGGSSDSGKILLDDSSLKIYGKTSGTNTATRKIDIYGDGGLNIYGNITANDAMEVRKDLTVTNGASIGIGTDSPSEKLEVAGNMLMTSDGQSQLRIVSTSSLPTSWRTRLYMDRGDDSRSGGVWIDATTDNQPIWFSGVPYQGNGYQIGYHSSQPEYKDSAKFFIQENGNIGIGTISPNTKLEVVGGPIRAGGVNATSQAEYTEIGHGGGNGYISTTGDGNLDFRHDENTRMSITPGGNVGIGITSPADKLDVRGTLRLSTSNNHARMYIGTIPGRGIGLVFEIKSSHHGSNRKIIWDGDNNWDSPSDESLKSNISQEKNILERLVQLDVKSYNWKDTYNQKKAEPIIGFMAQEVKPLFPSLVGEVQDEDTKKKLMTLKYASFGVLAVGAIKELRAEKDAEITRHKQLIDELNTKVEKLEKQLV